MQKTKNKVTEEDSANRYKCRYTKTIQYTQHILYHTHSQHSYTVVRSFVQSFRKGNTTKREQMFNFHFNKLNEFLWLLHSISESCFLFFCVFYFVFLQFFSIRRIYNSIVSINSIISEFVWCEKGQPIMRISFSLFRILF